MLWKAIMVPAARPRMMPAYPKPENLCLRTKYENAASIIRPSPSRGAIIFMEANTRAVHCKNTGIMVRTVPVIQIPAGVGKDTYKSTCNQNVPSYNKPL